jgi:hypothetical protein
MRCLDANDGQLSHLAQREIRRSAPCCSLIVPLCQANAQAGHINMGLGEINSLTTGVQVP